MKHTIESWEKLEQSSTQKEVVKAFDNLSPEEQNIVAEIVNERRRKKEESEEK